jgi:hypothetical protein
VFSRQLYRARYRLSLPPDVWLMTHHHIDTLATMSIIFIVNEIKITGVVYVTPDNLECLFPGGNIVGSFISTFKRSNKFRCAANL